MVRNRRLRGWKSNFVVYTSYRFAHRRKNRSNAGTSRTRGRVPMANWREKILFLYLIVAINLFLILQTVKKKKTLNVEIEERKYVKK